MAVPQTDYIWAPVASVEDYGRARIDKTGRPFIDGVRVNVRMYEAFMAEWSAFYEANEPSDGR